MRLLRAPFFFWWVTPHVRRGWRHELQQPDAATAAAWAAPQTEILLAWSDQQEGTYARRLWLRVHRRLIGSGALYAFYCGTQLLQPFLLRRVVQSVEAGGTTDGVGLALSVGAAGVLGSLAKEQQVSSDGLGRGCGLGRARACRFVWSGRARVG